MLLGSRNSAITEAFEMSAWYMSPSTNVALSPTPAAVAVRLRKLHHLRIEFDAHCPRAPLGGGNDVAAVAGSEIHDKVLRRDLGQVEHRFYELRGRRHPDDIFARLADLRDKRFLLGRRLGAVCSPL